MIRFFHVLWTWGIEYKFKLFYGLCNASLTIFGVYTMFHSIWIGGCIILASLGGIIFPIWDDMSSRKKEKNCNGCMKEKKELQQKCEVFDVVKGKINSIFDCCLCDIAKDLRFESTERISLYIVLDNNFVLCSRVAHNPSCQNPGRPSYPINEGAIGKIWEEGEWFENQIPDYSSDSKGYAKYIYQIYKIKGGVSKKLTMKSRLYYGVRLHDYDKSAPVGVLLIESMKNEKYTKKQLAQGLEVDRDYLYKMVKAFKEYIPALYKAQQAGEF